MGGLVAQTLKLGFHVTPFLTLTQGRRGARDAEKKPRDTRFFYKGISLRLCAPALFFILNVKFDDALRRFLTAVMVCLPLLAEAANIREILPQCFDCHGKNGVSQGPTIPTIAGLSEKTLSQALLAYKQGKRAVEAEQHRRLAGSEQRIQALAAYFAQQKFIPSRQASVPEQVERGLYIHLDYCEKCHRDNGTRDHLGSGILAGQKQSYLRSSLNAFYSGEREMPEKKAKRLEALLEEQALSALEDLLHFYAYQGQQLLDKLQPNTSTKTKEN